MAIRFYNPTSPGRRQGTVIDYKSVLTKFTPERSLTVGQTRASGRNHHGVITAKHHGGGNKRLYRIIDFKRIKDGISATVESIALYISSSGSPTLTPPMAYPSKSMSTNAFAHSSRRSG